MDMNITVIRDFFMWCAIINVALLFVSAVLCAAFLDKIHRLHSKFFPMTKETFSVVIYSILGMYKLMVIGFVLVPYLALLIMT